MKANAKLNLTLNVEGMYDEKFHRLSSVITTIDVSDTVTVKDRQDKNISVTIDGELHNENAAYKVAEAIINRRKTMGVDIIVNKGIAVMGGMGGSSVDAAATIVAMVHLFDLSMDQEMLNLASEFGSDIAYMIVGGLGIASGKGDDIMFVNNNNILNFVVINGARLSTTEVFNEYDNSPDLTKFDNMALLDALANEDIEHARKYLGNNLQPAAIRLQGVIGDIINTCSRLNIPTPIMTGSGGNLFILCKDSKEANKIVSKLDSEGIKSFATVSANCGIETL